MSQEIPIQKLERKDENGNVVGSVTPVLKVIERGAAVGNVYPCIEVTEENFNEYVQVRGIKEILDRLNQRERADAQGTLDHVLSADTDWEQTGQDKKGNPTFTYYLDKFIGKISQYYEELISGKVRGGVTIVQLEEELEDLLKQQQDKIAEMQRVEPAKAAAIMKEAFAITTKYKDIQAQIEEIRQARKPRMTKEEKLKKQAEEAAAAAKAAAPAAPVS